MKIFATSVPHPDATLEQLAEDMDAEIAQGKQFYLDGLIEQAYMDPTYTRTYMVLEASDVETAAAAFDAYPQVAAGLISFTFTPLVGLPAIADAERARGGQLPSWWPATSSP